jgi:hypothetical protein
MLATEALTGFGQVGDLAAGVVKEQALDDQAQRSLWHRPPGVALLAHTSLKT